MSEDFKVKDINQADFGRKEISIAETEMPGLMALRQEYKGKKYIRCRVWKKRNIFSRNRNARIDGFKKRI